jgi:hypothetical protein
MTESVSESEKIQAYEPYQNYKKETVIESLKAIKDERLLEQFYNGNDEIGRNVNLVFLTLQTGDHPKEFTHLCNNSSLKWNIKSLNISSSSQLMSVPNIAMLFVRGKNVEGTSERSEEYKYLGLIGVQSLSSGPNKEGTYIYYVVTRKELEWFGDNLMKCKKNKYGCALCN